MTLGIIRDDERTYELVHSRFKGTFIFLPPIFLAFLFILVLCTDTIDDAIVLCQNCRHGGHASHILDWFFGQNNTQAHPTCAIADCDCRCADEF
jgi:Zinc-ribbon like family